MKDLKHSECAFAESQPCLSFEGEPLTYYGRRTALYKVALILQDLFIVLAVFLSGWLVSSQNLSGLNGIRELLICGIAGLVAISYLTVFNTYSYHLIFSRIRHVSMLVKAMGWGGIALGTIGIIYRWPDFFEGVFLAPVMIIFACIILVLSRYYSDQLTNLIMALGISFIATSAFELLKTDEVPVLFNKSWVLQISYFISTILIIAGRLFIVQFIFNKILRKHFRRQVAIIGSNENAMNIVNHIIECNAPFWVAGFVGDSETDSKLNLDIGKPCLGSIQDLSTIVASNQINEIIVTDEQIDKLTLISILDFCTSHRIAVWFPPKLMPIIEVKLYIDSFCGLSMIRIGGGHILSSNVFEKVKTGIDVLLGLFIFILQLPLFIFIAVAIKLDSKGPVFYRAKAIGKNGKMFRMFKFRSMCTDNKSDIHKEYVTKLIKGEIKTDGNDGKPLKIVDDPRITRIGHIIRKYSLDELPQLLNVMRSEMSIVGPRPCLPYEYEIYLKWHKKRTDVRPGISGLWQVAGRSEVAFEDMILLDLYYIYNSSFSMDFSILFETAFVVFGKKGAY